MHMHTLYVSSLLLSLTPLNFSRSSFSLYRQETPFRPRSFIYLLLLLHPPPPAFLTCRECVAAIAVCTDIDTLPRERKRMKKCLISTSSYPSPPSLTSAMRVSFLVRSLSRFRCCSMHLYGDTRGTVTRMYASCTLRHDTIRSADRLRHPTAFNLVLLFLLHLLLLLFSSCFVPFLCVSVYLLLIHPSFAYMHAIYERVCVYTI